MKVCFTGPRLYKIGYSDNWKEPGVAALILKIKEVVEQIMEENPREVQYHFITGGALGIDQIAFAVCNKLKRQEPRIFNEIAVPFTMQMLDWTPDQKYKYTCFLKQADDISYVDTSPKYNPKMIQLGGYAPFKYQARNEYMVDESELVIAIWDGKMGIDGTKSGTYNCIKYAKESNKEILYINPYTLEVYREKKEERPEQLRFA